MGFLLLFTVGINRSFPDAPLKFGPFSSSIYQRREGGEVEGHRRFQVGGHPSFRHSTRLHPVNFRGEKAATSGSPEAYVRLELNLIESQSSAKVRFCSFEARHVDHAFDNRWVPPSLITQAMFMLSWTITPALGIIMISFSAFNFYAIVMRLSFLQGNPCHLLSLKLHLVNCLSKLCSALSAHDLFLRGSYTMLFCFWELLLNLSAGQVLRFGVNLHRPVLLWFEFSGLQPPWQVSRALLSNARVLPSLLWSLCICWLCFLGLMKSSGFETVARKHIWVVYDGTIAQVHTCFEFVAACLTIRHGSSDIGRHGWGPLPINDEFSKTWKATLVPYWYANRFVIGMYPEFGLWINTYVNFKFIN